MNYDKLMRDAIKMQDISDDILLLVKAIKKKEITKKEVIDKLNILADNQYIKTSRFCTTLASYHMNNQ